MKQPKEKKSGGCITFLLVLMTAASLFVTLGSIFMLKSGEDTGVAVACIAIGIIGTLLFGCGTYAVTHSGNRFIGPIIVGVLIFGGIGLAVALLGGMLYAVIINPFVDAEHYRQVYQNPVTVSAIVTDHKSYNDEGDTDYTSYVTYIYDNVRYNNFPYEDRDTEDALTPLGQEVTIQISPKDPRQQISDLKRNSYIIPFFVVFIFLGLAVLYKFLLHRNLAAVCPGTPDDATIREDLHTKIRSRFMTSFSLLCWIGYGFLYLRYSSALGIAPLIVAVVSFAIWVCCVHTDTQDHRHVEAGNYKLSQDTLTDKQEYTDSEGSTSYTLSYSNGTQIWKRSCSAHAYLRAKVGDTVLAIYLPSKKKPVIHYDADGNAH